MTVAELRPFLIQVLIKKGMYAYEAEIVADRLLDADALGRPREGCASLASYLDCMDMGDIDPRAIALRKSDTPATALIDANEGMGQVAATKAMETAIEKARAVGIGMVLVANSQQLGCPLVYARMAALQGLIGLCLSSTAEKILPGEDGATHLFLGSQPMAYAVPYGETSLGFDFSFQPESNSKVTLPAELSAPLGLLHAVLTCGLTGERMPSEKTRGPHLERTEHVMVAINPEAFAGIAKLQRKTEALEEYFRQHGLPLDVQMLSADPFRTISPELLSQLQAIAVRAKVPWPEQS